MDEFSRPTAPSTRPAASGPAEVPEVGQPTVSTSIEDRDVPRGSLRCGTEDWASPAETSIPIPPEVPTTDAEAEV